MALACELCGKKPSYGNTISHAHNVTRRRWNPNLRRVSAVVNGVTQAGPRLHLLHPLRPRERKPPSLAIFRKEFRLKRRILALAAIAALRVRCVVQQGTSRPARTCGPS